MREMDERDCQHGLADTQQDEIDRKRLAGSDSTETSVLTSEVQGDLDDSQQVSQVQAAYNFFAFEYQFLSRLKQDCDYYLAFGQRQKKHLWALDEAAQIQKMKEVYAELPEKPEWITLADIEKYEAEMVCSTDAALAEANMAYQQDGEVIGKESDGSLIQWNGETQAPYTSSEKLEDFGAPNLTVAEKQRIGLEP